jgi:hypothetical protein
MPQLRLTVEQWRALASQRSDILEKLPPLTRLDDDTWITEISDEMLAILNELDWTYVAEPTPEVVELWQFRAILTEESHQGQAKTLLQALEEEIAAMPDAQKTRYTQALNFGMRIFRRSPLANMLVETLALADEEVNELFRRAARIPHILRPA